MWFAYGLVWFSTALAACAGMYFTHSAWCLWVFIFPACVKITQGKKEKEHDAKNKDDIKRAVKPLDDFTHN